MVKFGFSFDSFVPDAPVCFAEGTAFSNNQQTFLTVPAKSEMERGDRILMAKLDLNWKELPEIFKAQTLAEITAGLAEAIKNLFNDSSDMPDEWFEERRNEMDFFESKLAEISMDIQHKSEAVAVDEENLKSSAQKAKTKNAREAKEEAEI